MPGEQLQKMIDEAIRSQRGEGSKEREPFPPAWKPNVGDVLEALIIKQIEVKNKTGGTRLVRIVIDRQGNQIALPSSTGVVRELIRAKASVGDFLYVRYEGEKAAKSQPADGTFRNPFKLYTVVVISKDSFERTGEKFPAPKPVPKREQTDQPAQTPPTVQPTPYTESAGRGPSTIPAPASQAAVDDKNVKRLADAVGKISGGMKVPQFENLYRQIVGDKNKKASDAALDFPDLFTVAVGADGTERVQRVQ